MNRPARKVVVLIAVVLALAVVANPAAAQSKIFINEFYRAGNLTTTDEWIEVVLTVPLTAAQLEGFYVGDSTGTAAAKFSGYKFTNMASIAANFPAGTIIGIGGTTGPAQDTAYNPAGGDWNIHLRTAGGFLTGNGSNGDLAGTDVAYVDTNGTNGNATISTDGFAVNWLASPPAGTLGAAANVTIAAPANNTGVVLTSDFSGSTTPANWSVSVLAASLTPGQPNGGANTIYINGLRGAAATPVLSINDVTLAEGDSGTTTFTFAVTLSAPAGVGGVTFDIATADGTAQDDNPAASEDNDYVAQSLSGQTIAAGSTGPFNFNVTVNGDSTTEPNETFFVNVTNVTGATVTDGQGQGTINNDDVTLTPIHDIQGPGASSPIVGSSITTRGVVTGVRSAGFYIQEPDATVDADPATSEGIYVFTSGAPPAAAVVGNIVQVTGTVAEYVPSADPLQPPLTELTSPTVVQLSTGNPLPAATPLTATFPDPAGPYDQLERVEGMRVSVASMTVVAPTLGNVNEPNATATSNGIFYGVVTGVARPFREAGIRAPDPAPAGTIPPIPRWDNNPELISVDSDGLTGTTLVNVATGAVVPNVVGPLDYTFRAYRILPETTLAPTGGMTATAATLPTGSELTIASYNLERFFDTAASGLGEPVLTAAAFANRLTKASLQIRDYLRTPDVLGVIEVENLTTLQALATQVNNDAVAASQPNPLYVAYLVEGNDVGGIDVGFLVKTAQVAAATPRVEVVQVQQELDGTLFVNPDSSTETLNDRPPLRLNAIVHHANGASFPVTVIVNHLRSLNGVDDVAAGSNGWVTVGDRVRAKRLAQANDLANLVQARQTADPAERIFLVGDFNAFDVNDGFVDSMATIAGTPVPNNETVVPGDGVDLVTPDLVNLANTPPAAERYGYVFDGTAQNIDHVVVNAQVVSGTTARRIEHPRVNTDFPETARSVYGTAVTRLSDHEPVVGYFQVPAFATADLSVTKTDSPDPVTAGTNLTWTITVTNNGPDAAATASFSDTLPAGTTFVSLPAVAAWSCSTPAVGATGTVSCSNASLAVGSAVFTLVVAVDPALAAGTPLSNTATATSTTGDPNAANNSATATTVVATSADLSVTKADAPDPVLAGSNVTYTIGVANAGPSDAASVSLSDTTPPGTTFVSLTSPGGWSCTTPAVGGTGSVSCSIASLAAAGNASFTLVVAVDAAVTGGTILSNTATVSTTTTDPAPANNSATATTAVNASSGVSIGVTATPEPVAPGGSLTWTITLTNSGPSPSNVTFSDALPAGTTFASLAPAAGWSCVAPTVGANGTVTCSNASFGVGNAAFTLVGTVGAGTALGSTLANTAAITAASNDTDPGDNSSTVTTNVLSPALAAATKSVAGALTPGSTVTYTVVVSNSGASSQLDNPGDELVDVLPAPLVLVSATATSGTAVATVGTNTVTWNGSIPAGGAVTVTISATIPSNVAVGTNVSNQATLSYDADGNGTNEATGVSDNPATGAAGDPTAFVVAAAAAAVIPTASGLGLGLLAALVALGGAFLLGRRLS